MTDDDAPRQQLPYARKIEYPMFNWGVEPRKQGEQVIAVELAILVPNGDALIFPWGREKAAEVGRALSAPQVVVASEDALKDMRGRGQ